MKQAGKETPKIKSSRWPHPLLMIFFIVAAFIFSQVFVGLLFWGAMFSLGYSEKEIEKLVVGSVALEFALLCLALILEMFIITKFIRHRKIEMKEIGWVAPKIADLGWAVAAFIGYIPVTIAVMALADWLIPGLNLDEQQDVGFESADTALELVVVFLGLVIITAIVEEFITRGVLYRGLKSRMAVLPAALITSFIFAAAHLNSAADHAVLLWSAAIDTFILSLMLVFLVEKTKSLWPGIFVHIFKNSLAFVFLFLL